ncbi:hypothetical protein OV079_03420 [Nannocystis pusilla]|uniref:Uncharacterized protein n=1 Tax=Nannocystis pusilla TaxID=889268 RepID=A0A9X3IVN2_9BACT|nr:hypothetical protein [Nannocystis pusilla]MCY1004634.1 hypothetical protein [Nannocystis pusilla]
MREQPRGAADAVVLLVTREQHADRARKAVRAGLAEAGHCGDEAGDRALHVAGAAPVQHAAAQLARKGVDRPALAGRADVDVSEERDVRRTAAEPRHEVGHGVAAGTGEVDASAGEPARREGARRDGERAAIGGGTLGQRSNEAASGSGSYGSSRLGGSIDCESLGVVMSMANRRVRPARLRWRQKSLARR